MIERVSRSRNFFESADRGSCTEIEIEGTSGNFRVLDGNRELLVTWLNS